MARVAPKADFGLGSFVLRAFWAKSALWDDNAKNTKQMLRLVVARKRRPWFEALWANAGEPVRLTPLSSNA